MKATWLVLRGAGEMSSIDPHRNMVRVLRASAVQHGAQAYPALRAAKCTAQWFRKKNIFQKILPNPFNCWPRKGKYFSTDSHQIITTVGHKKQAYPSVNS